LDRCWAMLAECFEPAETGIRRAVIENHWPRDLAEPSREEQAEREPEAVGTKEEA
ncbi:MAG: hypothetical protein ISS74_06140, partial [Planctomycetes bacterium]|nr:hypothetical protein [Planctomycetota bacterium]